MTVVTEFDPTLEGVVVATPAQAAILKALLTTRDEIAAAKKREESLKAAAESMFIEAGAEKFTDADGIVIGARDLKTRTGLDKAILSRLAASTLAKAKTVTEYYSISTPRRSA